MKTSARIQSVIELLDLQKTSGKPADNLIGDYFRNRRFIGSKDKKFIASTFYGILRKHYELSWVLNKADTIDSARNLCIADAALNSNEPLQELFSSGIYCSGELNRKETELYNFCKKAEIPVEIKLNYPLWLEGELRKSLGDNFENELMALNSDAPLDLRVNTLKSTREKVSKELNKLGIEHTLTPYSNIGIRIVERTPIFATDIFKEGHIEVQDEGSQIVAQLANAKPGYTVIDFCAGAGGKTLALAAQMESKGRLFAFDIIERKLEETKKRLRRAGVSNAHTHHIASESDQYLKRHKNSADIVVIDAPCSGTGTWRRNPDLKMRTKQENLDSLIKTQASIISSAARLLKPNGRLIYITCSILKQENEEQIEGFLNSNEGFTQLDCKETLAIDLPFQKGRNLNLSPYKTSTDGFFASILRKNSL